MLQELAEYLVNLAVTSEKPKTIYENERRILVARGGITEEINKLKPPRVHSACSVTALAQYASKDSIVWHNRNTVTLIVDDSDDFRSDRVNWMLTDSARFVAAALNGNKPRDHKSFVNFIVKNLREEFDRDVPGLLGVIRALKFSTSDEAEGEINHGRESMGRQIRSDVTGASELPETIKLNVNRWSELDIHVAIELMLVVDLDGRTLSLVPLADSVVKAELEAHRQLGDLISQSLPCDVLHGSH